MLKIGNKIKKGSCTSIPDYKFFGSTIPYHKSDLAQHTFLEVLCLYIAKGYRLLSLVENLWLKGFVMHENPKVVFPSCHHLLKEIFLHMVSKTMDNHVFPTLIHCITRIASFDLWMFCACYNIFAMVIGFIDFAWQRVHIIMGLFEIQNTSGDNMAK